jgi:sigma-B regulation protein RsbQ
VSISSSRIVLSLAAVLLTLAVACEPSPSVDAELPAGGPAPGDHDWTTPDGNRVPYSVAGKSDAEVTVVFVHCWMCDHSFWAAQLPVLAADYRTVTLDLPGHGEAGSARAAWTVAAYGEDVAGIVRELDLSNVVLVGHSMGGPVTLRAAALLPDRVLGIVAVDTLHDADFKFEGEQIENFMRAWEADFVGTCEQFIDSMFVEEGVDAVKTHVRATGCDGTRREAGVALMRNFGSIDMPAWFREAGVPIRAINARAPNPTRVENNRKYADFDVVFMEDVGHYLQMTRPDEFNELLVETIAGIVGG